MKYILPNKLYQVLKWVCMIALNAIGVLYATLAHLWGWPYGVEIPATLEAIAVCIGVLIGISAATAKPEQGASTFDVPVMTDDEIAAVFDDADDK